MSTYDTLRDRALNQTGLLGQSEAQTVAQIALEEAMKFVSTYVRIPSLIASATATQTATSDPDTEANALELFTSGSSNQFGITQANFQTVDRLYIAKDSDATAPGTPYDYMEYHQFLDLKNVPVGSRNVIDMSGTEELIPDYAFTITPDNKLWAKPASTNNVYTLFYRKSPAAYSGSATPEITPLWDFILTNGGVLALKEWLREPEAPLTLWELFKSKLMDDVMAYDKALQGARRRTHLRIHNSYRVR